MAVAGRDESEIEVPVLQPVPKRLKNVEQNEKAIQILLPGPVTGGEILGSGDQHKAASAGVVVQAKIPVEQQPSAARAEAPSLEPRESGRRAAPLPRERCSARTARAWEAPAHSSRLAPRPVTG